MTRRAFSDEQERVILARYGEGVTQRDLIREFGGSNGSIKHLLDRHGVTRRPKPPRRRLDEHERAEVVERYRGGETVKELARTWRCRDSEITAALNRAGVTIRLGGVHRRFEGEQAERLAAEYAAGASLKALAERYDSNQATIRATLRRLGEPIRQLGRPEFWTPVRLAWLVEQRRLGRSQADIARELGVSQPVVSARLVKAGEIGRPAYRREGHPAWRGGRTVTPEGYVRVVPTDADLPLLNTGGQAYVLEHRLVMARALGRSLRRNETVHHVNGDKADNRLSNLQLRQGNHGNGVVVTCLDCGSHNVGTAPIN